MAYRPNMLNYNVLQARGATGTNVGAGLGSIETEPAPDFGQLFNKYLGQMKEAIPTDKQALYEGMMGPARKDVQSAQTDIALGLQSKAVGGSNYEDLLARYLPGATAQLADVASQSAAAAEKYGQAGSVAATQAATQMAESEGMMLANRQQWMAELKTQVQLAERQINMQYDIARMNAQTQKEIAMIETQRAKELQRVQIAAEMETQKFLESQKNYREGMTMRLYDKYYTGLLDLKGKELGLKEAELANKYGGQTLPTNTTAGGGGSGWIQGPKGKYIIQNGQVIAAPAAGSPYSLPQETIGLR